GSPRGGWRRARALSGRAARPPRVDIPHAGPGSARAHEPRLSAAVRAGPGGAAQGRDARIAALRFGRATDPWPSRVTTYSLRLWLAAAREQRIEPRRRHRIFADAYAEGRQRALDRRDDRARSRHAAGFA